MWTERRPDLPATFVDRVVVAILVVALATFAGAKLAFGYRPGLDIAWSTYYLATALELLAAVLLLLRYTMAGALLTAAFFAVAILYSTFSGARACGCLGAVALSSAEYRMIAATLGVLATLLVQRRLYRMMQLATS